MQTVEPTEIVSAIHSAAEGVFSTMLDLPLESGPARQEPAGPATFDGVIALVGIGGDWTGTGRISFSARFACKLASALLQSPFESVDEDVLDAVAEVANMIIGNAKTVLEERLGLLALSTPTVIFGRNYKTRSASVLEWTVIPFRSGEEDMEVRFYLLSSKQHPHAALRP
jgi:chemotaxis protein CheX